MFLQELVEQHRVHRVITHSVNLAIGIAHYQVRVYFGHFLGDQTKFGPTRVVALVMEGHRLERQDCFAGLFHRCNLFFVPSRGTDRAELAGRVDQHWNGVGLYRCDATNVANKAAVVHVRTQAADTDNITGRGDSLASERAQRGVVGAVGVGRERTITQTSVAATGGVAKKRECAIGRVAEAFGIT